MDRPLGDIKPSFTPTLTAGDVRGVVCTRHGRRAGHDRLRPGPARDRDGHAQQGTTRLAHGPCLERSGPPLDETLKRYYCT